MDALDTRSYPTHFQISEGGRSTDRIVDKRSILSDIFIPIFLAWVAILSFPSVMRAGQVDHDVFIRLERGMSEAEVVFRAGPPDKEVVVESEPLGRFPMVRQLLYLPGPGQFDPHLTVITIESGRVREMERIKLLASPKPRGGKGIDFEIFSILQTGMTEAEVIARAGEPDREIFLSVPTQEAEVLVKQLWYISDPNQSEPFLTAITVKNGRVIDIERSSLLSQ